MLKLNIKERSCKFIIGSILAVSFVAAAFGIYHVFRTDHSANAYLNGFDPGNIMSDFVMGNKSTMSEADINTFLHSKNPCNDRNLSKKNGYEHLGYTIKDGHFVCMADEDFGGESAAHIIWQAAQDYSINPQVLIVTLQKEQGLVTDTWPNHNQYKKAMGFGCPDTGEGCNSKDAGFKNQIRKAAALFREVLNGGWSTYPAYSWQDISYQANAPQCGKAHIYIQNRATSALYRYTPYVPNQAALNAGYGSGDACSAYGNRNFYNYFTDWFGNTQTTVRGNIDLPDGVYTIHPAKDPSKSIDLDAGSQSDGAEIQLWDNIASSLGQQYQFTRNSDGYYTISSLASHKPITLAGSIKEGAKLVQGSDANQCSSKWAVVLVEGNYKLLSSCNGMAVDIPNSTVSNGKRLHIWGDNDTDAQRWVLQSRSSSLLAEGLYTIRSKQSDKVIDVSNGNRNDGATTQIWGENTNINTQKFLLDLQDDGLYVIKNINSGKVIDLSNANTDNGARIQTWGYNSSTCAQKWNLVPSNGGYKITSSCNRGYSIDIDGGEVYRDGAVLHLWKNGSQISQIFTFASTKPILESGTYTIHSSHDKTKVVDVNGGSKTAGEYIHLWSKINSLKSQQYNFYLEDNGYYSIQNVNSWLFLDIQSKANANGTRIVQRLGDGTLAQKWELVRQSDGSFTIVNAQTYKGIDLSNNSTSNGTKIHIWDQNNTQAQRWYIQNI